MIYNLYNRKKFFFYGINCDLVDFDNKEAINTFLFRELTIEDIEQSDIFFVKSRVSRYKNNLSNGHRCFGFVNAQGKVISYLWLSVFDKIPPLTKSVSLVINPGLAYIWDCRTSENYMRQGLYKSGLINLMRIIKKMNIDEVRICNLDDNLIATKTMLSLNFKFLYSVSVITFINLKLIFSSLLIHFSLKKNIRFIIK